MILVRAVNGLRLKSRRACSDFPICRSRYSTSAATPLRILFCGSDDFSATSLHRLHDEQRRNPDLIASVDVVCKAGKPSGRGLKKIRDVPIKRVAQEAGLRVHEISTFTGWQPPTVDGEAINLVIAVSFGLLVPPRILNGATYGGLNLHPSLLPALQGAAPLQHTILQDLQRSGVTLQTLHPKHFDRGQILARTSFGLDDSSKTSMKVLESFVAPLAADLLVKSLRELVFVPPLQPVAADPDNTPSHAPKLTPNDAQIDWGSWDAERILRTQRIFNPLWSLWPWEAKASGRPVRVQWHDLEMIEESRLCSPPILTLCQTYGILWRGLRAATGPEEPEFPIGGMRTCDGKLLSVRAITIEGGKKETPNDSFYVVDKLDSMAVR